MSTAARSLLAIIAGGDTPERDGSLASARHLNQILSGDYRTVLVELAGGSWTILDASLDGVPLSALALDRIPPAVKDLRSGETIWPDAALISIHGRPGETGELQGYLDILGIPYNGSGVLGSALAADKSRCKAFLQASMGLRSPPHVRFAAGTLSLAALETARIEPPFVIKPNDLGSAIGVLSVHSPDGLGEALVQAAAMRCAMLVEPFIDGMELTVGAARFRQRSLAFEAAEVVRPASSARQSVRRYASRKCAELVIPARLPQEVATELHRLTAAVGEALGLWGIYRADFVWDGANLHFLEVNTLPGTAENSVLVQQARVSGYPPERLFPRIAEDVLATRSPLPA